MTKKEINAYKRFAKEVCKSRGYKVNLKDMELEETGCCGLDDITWVMFRDTTTGYEYTIEKDYPIGYYVWCYDNSVMSVTEFTAPNHYYRVTFNAPGNESVKCFDTNSYEELPESVKKFMESANVLNLNVKKSGNEKAVFFKDEASEFANHFYAGWIVTDDDTSTAATEQTSETEEHIQYKTSLDSIMSLTITADKQIVVVKERNGNTITEYFPMNTPLPEEAALAFQHQQDAFLINDEMFYIKKGTKLYWEMYYNPDAIFLPSTNLSQKQYNEAVEERDAAIAKQITATEQGESPAKEVRRTRSADIPPHNSMEGNLVLEMCPNCGREVEMVWNIAEKGFQSVCPYCGERLMLCDECLHQGEDGEYTDNCDYDRETDTCWRSRKT